MGKDNAFRWTCTAGSVHDTSDILRLGRGWGKEYFVALIYELGIGNESLDLSNLGKGSNSLIVYCSVVYDVR